MSENSCCDRVCSWCSRDSCVEECKGCCGNGSLWCGDDKCLCYSGCSANKEDSK